MGSAPSKSLPSAAKQQLILDYLRASQTCHTLKDLEKCLPSVASINGMQVKDYIQALADDGKLHVEKIGSGNWYWAWAGEEQKEREKVKRGLVKELEKLERVVVELEERKKAALAEIGDRRGDEDRDREKLVMKKAEREAEMASLRAEEESYLNGGAGGGGIEMKEADIQKWKEEAEMWTDNIYVLEQFLAKLAGGDREIIESVKRECYGQEYVEGEGLRELQF
ncbi:conserved hypothetical protein [Histoplasma capsulatum G186AR]|uniref:Meiotic nuclear division protein 1 n=1 Tax=Ajellomyces capsulatus (strain G186AR / H82 / ATCC MYA-2454 / RMSCC 2432) TaxID=447093 RepID=C0NXF6_AJECG|nr:uncharacterized protein HCBG_08148 [Histoplasma capsulatum G186AR]EEH04022.1 conserved hypothetical protein [Histoplasma capsulatum G186AR]